MYVLVMINPAVLDKTARLFNNAKGDRLITLLNKPPCSGCWTPYWIPRTTRASTLFMGGG